MKRDYLWSSAVGETHNLKTALTSSSRLRRYWRKASFALYQRSFIFHLI